MYFVNATQKRTMDVFIHDETLTGSMVNQLRLRLNGEQITVKDLIKARVFHEAQTHNARRTGYFNGLVCPTQARPTLNGYQVSPKYKIDPQQQYYVAMDAFHRKSFYVVVEDQKIEDPNYTIRLRPRTRVSFMRLAKLVGG